MSDKPSVLFVRVPDAGRSQMAAAWLTHLAGQGVEAVCPIRDDIERRVRGLLDELGVPAQH